MSTDTDHADHDQIPDAVVAVYGTEVELTAGVHSGVVLSWAVTGKLIFMGCVVVGVGVSGSLLGV